MFPKIVYVVLMITLLHASGTGAENAARSSQNGLLFELYTALYVYAPEDTLEVHYRIRNIDHPGIVLSFSSSQRVDIIIETPAGLTGSNVLHYSPSMGREYIPEEEAYSSGIKVTLASFFAAERDTIGTLPASVSDGDTLSIYGRSAASVFGIEEPEQMFQRYLMFVPFFSHSTEPVYKPELDINDDGRIDFQDFLLATENRFIMDWHKLPEQSKLSLSVIIRAKTADLDRDNSLGSGDFDVFIRAFGSSMNMATYDARADLDGNGAIDFRDFLEYVSLLGDGK